MPKYNKPRTTWRYADEFKIRAVEVGYREGKIMSDGLKRVSVMKSPKIPSAAEITEMIRLTRKNERPKKENDLLKKRQLYRRNNIRAIWIHPGPRTKTRRQIPL